MSNGKRHTGEVLSFEFGWGFIDDYDTKESIFVHHSNIDAEGYRELFPMDKVSFIVGEGSNGRKQALNVLVLEEG
ncbi:cold shock domain-containing protein [bacterium]|nr:MAG: cold shock domain-containing protein [bacterium]